jgi:hypothetical protein
MSIPAADFQDAITRSPAPRNFLRDISDHSAARTKPEVPVCRSIQQFEISRIEARVWNL